MRSENGRTHVASRRVSAFCFCLGTNSIRVLNCVRDYYADDRERSKHHCVMHTTRFNI